MAKTFEIKQDSVNNIPIPYANSFQTKDGSEIPVKSPKLLPGNGGTIDLKVPHNAVQLIVYSELNDTLQVSLDNFDSYYDLIANQPEKFDCAGIENISIKNVNQYYKNVHFRFVLL